MHPIRWLRAHDAGLWALRRAARTAIVMPTLFAYGFEVLHNSTLATFAAFGSFALLLLADFSGSLVERLSAVAWLAGSGAVLICLATLVSQTPWLAAVVMTAVGSLVLFAGVISSVLASASTALLVGFVLPVTTPVPITQLPDRLAGWGLASAGALLAVGLLWPAPARSPLRAPAVDACRLLATRMRTDVAFVLGEDGLDEEQRNAAAARARDATAGLRTAFYATPNRPTGLTTAARTVVRLVDELDWLVGVLDSSVPQRRGAQGLSAQGRHREVHAVKLAVADVLDLGADLLADTRHVDPDPLARSVASLQDRLHEMEAAATMALPTRSADGEAALLSGLDPTFRAQELTFAVTAVANNILGTAAAERRNAWQRLLGQEPDGVPGALAAARERALAHLDVHSVWLHNSLRGGIGLGAAVLVADLSALQHSFWIVLGTLSVLRSNALSTGQNVLRGLAGTVIGIVAGGLLVSAVGTDRAVLWILLPLCIVLAGLAPAAISFAAGQAAFTLVLFILFNIIAPVGYRLGFARIEDIAIGCAVSAVVGALFWPRGASAALRRALAEAYTDSASYLQRAVAFGTARCEGAGSVLPPRAESQRAAAASRRLDDAFREYLAEQGTKRLALAEATTLVTGTIAPRLAADAVLEMWDCKDAPVGDRGAARAELEAAAALMTAWYQEFAAALVRGGPVPDPLPHDAAADGRLVTTVDRDLRRADGSGTPTAIRMIWTGDHLDAVRRQQASVVTAARA
ncbi:FUSC family protein [uncultured Jatrophihabitans sp.]|uniref:FUSC family protein n=1 Tax=uncultured Jatrophihabitans sp. TaxID=1610747 RepID=UPI0035CBF64A